MFDLRKQIQKNLFFAFLFSTLALVRIKLMLPLINEEGDENTNFLDQFNSYGVSKNSKIFFICKSGARSMHAALILESNGYQNLYNVEDGFVIGWKPSGLPSK